MCGDDGKRFKTRSSETVKLIDLLDEAKRRMHETLKSRVEEGRCDQWLAPLRTPGVHLAPPDLHTHTHTHTHKPAYTHRSPLTDAELDHAARTIGYAIELTTPV